MWPPSLGRIFFLVSNWNLSCCILCPLALVLLLCTPKKSLVGGEKHVYIFLLYGVITLQLCKSFQAKNSSHQNWVCFTACSRERENPCNPLIICWDLKRGRKCVSCFHIACTATANSHYLGQQKWWGNISSCFNIWQILSSIWLPSIQ